MMKTSSIHSHSATRLQSDRATFGKSHRGFSLIELLTVIAIIGILAAILIPVVGAVRESARNANCQSNLRQIGAAVHSYMADNPQSDRLPGPTWIYLYPFNNVGLGKLLTPYLGTVEHSHGDEAQLVEVMVCPSYDAIFNVRGMPFVDSAGGSTGDHVPRPYRANTTQRDQRGLTLLPFGDGNGDIGRGGNDAVSPRSLSELEPYGPSRVWLLTDSHGNPNTTITGASIPAEAPHGNGTARNYLFLDGSVRSLNANEHTWQRGW